MNQLKLPFATDTWLPATWEEYIQAIEDPYYSKAKGYYHEGRMRLEMTPLGHDHACDNTIISFAINLFCSLRGIPVKGLTNCSYRKIGSEEAQPDMSYYLGDAADVVPWGTSMISLDTYPAPTLVIEIANSSLADDKGEKRLLYETLGVTEYWILDVQKTQILAFAIAEGGSKRISQSLVLPDLPMQLLQEALQKSRQMNQGQVCAWLIDQFQK